MSTIPMIASKARNSQTELPLLTEEECAKFNSLADAIRYCRAKYPTVSYGSIATLLSKHQGKKVLTQHVYNVCHQVLKRKK